MKNCYILFVKTGCEEKIVNILKSWLDLSLFLPFVPTREKLFRRNGKTTRIMELVFGGYIFIESELSSDNFIIEVTPIIIKLNEAYRIINYGDKRDIAMRAVERNMLKNLYGSNYCIVASVGFIEGDRIRINEGSLMGMENVIKKINRHKREAIIEIEIMGSLRQVTVGLEIIEKI